MMGKSLHKDNCTSENDSMCRDDNAGFRKKNDLKIEEFPVKMLASAKEILFCSFHYANWGKSMLCFSLRSAKSFRSLRSLTRLLMKRREKA